MPEEKPADNLWVKLVIDMNNNDELYSHITDIKELIDMYNNAVLCICSPRQILNRIRQLVSQLETLELIELSHRCVTKEIASIFNLEKDRRLEAVAMEMSVL